MLIKYNLNSVKQTINYNYKIEKKSLVLKLMKIFLNLALIIICIYMALYSISGIILQNLPIKSQIQLENILSKYQEYETITLDKNEIERIDKIKKDILKIDKNFPKTSNLQINIINDKGGNAFCSPNGNIYITQELYKRLNTDEMLTYVIAHEMAHYRNKDHLLSLRKNIASIGVISLILLNCPDNIILGQIIDSAMSYKEINISREMEYSADEYAAYILKNQYGTTQGSIDVLNLFQDNSEGIERLFSEHPNPETRKKKLEEY